MIDVTCVRLFATYLDHLALAPRHASRTLDACEAMTWFPGNCFLHPARSSLGPAIAREGKVSAIVRPGLVPTPPPPQPIRPAPPGAKNVLFLISDDLRPEMLEACMYSPLHPSGT